MHSNPGGGAAARRLAMASKIAVCATFLGRFCPRFVGYCDNDGLVDLYVANVYEANRLYRNKGDGTFA